MSEETVVCLGSGGGYIELDVPAEGSPQRERFDEQIEKGELRIVSADSVRWEESQYGEDKDGKKLSSKRLVPVDGEPAKKVAGKKVAATSPPKDGPVDPPVDPTGD